MPGFWPSRSWPTRGLVALYWPIYGTYVLLTAACRIFNVPVENRVFAVGVEDRSFLVPEEDRVYEVSCGR